MRIRRQRIVADRARDSLRPGLSDAARDGCGQRPRRPPVEKHQSVLWSGTSRCARFGYRSRARGRANHPGHLRLVQQVLEAEVADLHARFLARRGDTIEQILGLPPRNQFDLAAEPMFSTFTAKADLTPYTVRPNTIPLDEMNPPLAGLRGLQRDLAKFSLTIDSSEPDSAPADLLNRAIWHSVKGFDTPYNYGRPIRRDGVPKISLSRLAGF
jgi:hypothetical protein